MANSVSGNTVQQQVAKQMDTDIARAESFAKDVTNFIYKTPTLQNLHFIYDYIDPVVATGYVSSAANNVPSTISLGSISAVAPTAPVINTITVPDFGSIPELLAAAPILNLPTAPSRDLPSAPGAAPSFDEPLIPAAPSFTLPDVPTFANVAIPVIPSYSLPTYTSNFPDDDLLAPTSTFNYVEEQYTSALLDGVKSKLLIDLMNGGYGIESSDEQMLWERLREREVLAGEAVIKDATRQVAARGFALPPGALNALVEGAQQAALEKISSVNRDVALKRADMYVENRKFTIEQSKEVEQMLMTYFGYRMERALNVAKYTAEFGIQIFNALVSKYNARLEATRVGAQVYETQLRAALAGLEAYKTEVEGARLTVEVQRLHADVYRTQLDGVQAYVNIYRTQMEAAQIQGEIEKMKLDAFRSTVDAYTAQVGARTAEFQMYEAQIRGETTKIDIFRANVDAYGAQVSAYGTKAQAQKTVVDAEISVASLKVDAYRAQIQAYGEELQKAQVTLQAQLQKYEADLKRYSVLVDAGKSSSNAYVDAQKANAVMAVNAAQVVSSHITNSGQVEVSHNNLAASAAGGMFGNYSQRVVAMAGQINALVAEVQSA